MFFFINTCGSTFDDSPLTTKNLVFIISVVVTVMVFLWYIVIPALYLNESRALTLARIHSEKQDFVDYVLLATADNMINPTEAVKINLWNNRLDDEYREQSEQERVTELKQKLREGR